MTLEILATGSTGNCTLVNGEFLIDCGKPPTWTLNALKYKLPKAILLTHEHTDHSRAVKNFLKRGVDIYTTRGTADFLGIARHNLHIIKAGDTFNVCGVKVEVLPSVHDAAEPVNFILSDVTDRVLYVTDTGKPPEVSDNFTKIYIEANYSINTLWLSRVDKRQRQRISRTHLSIEQVEQFLRAYRQVEVHLLHVSKRHGNAGKFYQRIQK